MKVSLSRRAAAARRRLSVLVWMQIGVLLFGQCSIGFANPNGGTVVSGSAAISSSGNLTTINQSSNRAIINWRGFSIGAGETTQFIQPGANSAILNRVTGAQMSQLMGTLQANGQVFLINPNGILIGSGATINVGGFTASTLDVSNSQFMQGGDLTFSGSSKASVINQGNVTAIGGDIYLIGSHVENHGVLNAANGTVGLAAGQEVKLVDSGSQALVVRATGSSLGGTGVLNTGVINGVRAELAANGGNVYALAINNTGVVRVTGAVRQNGRVLLTAPGGKIANSGNLIAKNADGSAGQVTIDSSNGTSGVTNVSGSIDVSGTTGGRVEVLGDEVNLTGASIDAYGAANGGVVLIGGDYQGNNPAIANAQNTTIDTTSIINADATTLGDGGQVIVWADGNTDFAGTITARGGADGGNGGFVEVSGKQTLAFGATGFADTTAANGETGTLLLDPGRVNIGTPTLAGFGTETIAASTVRQNWPFNNIIITTAADGSGSGPDDINVWENLNPTFFDFFEVPTDNSFTLNAGRDINLFANIRNTGNGNFSFTAGQDVNFMSQLQSGAIVLGSPVGGGTIDIIAGRNVTLAADPGDIKNPFNPLATRNVRVESFGGNINVTAGNNAAVGGNFQVFGANGNVAVLGSRFGDVDISATSAPAGNRGNVLIESRGGRAQVGFDRQTPLGVGPLGADITIAADGRIDLTADGAIGAIAKIGHGGDGLLSAFNGDINITQGERIRIQALSEDSTAQIGHGGPNTAMLFVPNVSPPTGDITVDVDRAQIFANGEGSTAMLGHGGRDGLGTAVGDISLTVADDLRIGTFDPTQPRPALALRQNANAQIGHGGRNFDASFAIPGSLFGNIEVIATATDLTMDARGTNDVVQIGHGGFGAIGSVGNINLSMESVGLSAAGAGSTVQIGHGGPQSAGSHDGNIRVTATGTTAGTGFVRLNASGGASGTLSGSTAQIGHGGREATGRARGNIEIIANGPDDATAAIDLSTPGNNNFAHIGHGGLLFNSGLRNPGDLRGNINLTAVRGGIAGMAGALRTGVQVGHGGGASTFGNAIGNIIVNSAADVAFTGGTNALSYAQVGHGGPLAVATGNIQGGIDITQAVNLTFMAGSGSQSYAQLGHGGNSVAANQISGGIRADLSGNVTFNGGGNLSFARLGHGGSQVVSNNPITGDISVRSVGDMSFAAGTGDRAFVQLGHGGEQFTGSVNAGITVDTGNLSFTAGTAGENAFAQLGHGGNEAAGNFVGDIRVRGGQIDFMAGANNDNYAQLGHGGDNADGNHSGNIQVVAMGDLNFTAGSGDDAYAQLGHGGNEVDATLITGGIRVTANDINFTAGSNNDTYAQLGHGGDNADGNLQGTISIVRANNLNFLAGSGNDSYAQLGLGGLDADGDHVGDILIDEANNLTFTAGSQDNSYVQLGHGGPNADGVRSGAIIIATANNLTFSGGDAIGAYAQLGHGGRFGDGEKSGAINITAANNLSFNGGTTPQTYAQLGHGGIAANGEINGAITIGRANNLSFQGGTIASYAQLGHGGVNADGNHNGAITISSANDLSFIGGDGENSYAQLGHGGRSTDGDHIGAITITSARDLSFTGGTGSSAYAQLGHGGRQANGNHTGNITIAQANNVNFMGGDSSFTYAQLGHGGAFSGGSWTGDIQIGQANDIMFAGGESGNSYAQLGHGGAFSSSSNEQTGNIIINQANDLIFSGGPARSAYAQLGHGGFFVSADQTGEITIRQANNFVFTGESVFSSYAMLGHGGQFVRGNQTGGITIQQANNIVFGGGSGQNASAQLGHGGFGIDGDQVGDINIQRAKELTFTGGTGDDAYAQLGHGGPEVIGDQTGNITIQQANDLTISGGTNTNAYAQVGHRGGGTEFEEGEEQVLANTIPSTQTGDISVRLVGSDLFLTAGAGTNAYAQLGHGDAAGITSGQRNGNISVIIDGTARLTGNSPTERALLGHGTTTPGGINGDLVLAIDQIDPLADNGGRLFMNQFSAIDMGGLPNEVRIFGTRRLGNTLADGAMINGVVVDSSLPPGTFTGDRWNPNFEFVTWNHEQWGWTYDQFTLAQPGPYTAPFTFYYLGVFNIFPDLPPQLTAFNLPYDRFVRYSDYANSIFQMFPNGPYRMYYGLWPNRPLEGEETGANSAHTYSDVNYSEALGLTTGTP